MARVKMIKPEEADADTRKVYEGVVRAMGPHQQFFAGAGASAGGAGGLDAAERRRSASQCQIRSGLCEDPAARHHQDFGAQPQRLLHVAQCAAGKEDRPHRRAGRSRAGQGLHGLGRSRRPAEGRDPLGRGGHADAGARRRRSLRGDEETFQREADRRAHGLLRHVELFQPPCEALHVDLERPDKRIEFQDE